MIERASRTVNGYEGCISVVDSNGRTIWTVDAHRGDGKRFVACADEKLTAFVELLPANQFREDKNAWQFAISEGRRHPHESRASNKK